jgi:secondary thiamine-phosphate synthase enzyme
MDSVVVEIATGRRPAVVDLTDRVAHFLADKGDGLCSVFVPHATAGLALMETRSGSEDDLLAALLRVLPRHEDYRHRHGAEGHGADHVVPAFIAPSVTIPVRAGQMSLGTWQSLVLVDTNVDNPNRQVRISFLAG